jgi:uncharacterized sulfatase
MLFKTSIPDLMNRPGFSTMVIAGSAGLFCSSPLFAHQPSQNKLIQPEKPNVVLIIIDDMGWKQLSCYGSNFYNSPNIDLLTKSGVRFTSAYSAGPVSSPTRASIMTGKYPARLHLTDYIPGNNVQDKQLIVPEWQKVLLLEEKTIAEVMKSNGYITALFGKWHLSIGKFGPESIPNNPDKQGFDETFLTFKPSSELPLGFWQKPELDGHNTDTVTTRATEFILRNRENPFLLVVSYDAIHNPLMEREKTITKYRNLIHNQAPEQNPILAAMVERLDNGIGRIINSLQINNLTDNTLIVLMSDNGGLESDASQKPLKHGKGWLYEGGIRVPLIVVWNKKIPGGTVSDQPVSSIDLMPTILDFVGIRDNLPYMDGISLVGLLTDNLQSGRESLFWNYPHYHQGPPSAAVRQGDYKLIEWYENSLTGNPGAFELFDLKADTGENNNLINELPEVVTKMKDDLSKWRSSVNAQIPAVNLNFKTIPIR